MWNRERTMWINRRVLTSACYLSVAALLLTLLNHGKVETTWGFVAEGVEIATASGVAAAQLRGIPQRLATSFSSASSSSSPSFGFRQRTPGDVLDRLTEGLGLPKPEYSVALPDFEFSSAITAEVKEKLHRIKEKASSSVGSSSSSPLSSGLSGALGSASALYTAAMDGGHSPHTAVVEAVERISSDVLNGTSRLGLTQASTEAAGVIDAAEQHLWQMLSQQFNLSDVLEHNLSLWLPAEEAQRVDDLLSANEVFEEKLQRLQELVDSASLLDAEAVLEFAHSTNLSVPEITQLSQRLTGLFNREAVEATLEALNVSLPITEGHWEDATANVHSFISNLPGVGEDGGASSSLLDVKTLIHRERLDELAQVLNADELKGAVEDLLEAAKNLTAFWSNETTHILSGPAPFLSPTGTDEQDDDDEQDADSGQSAASHPLFTHDSPMNFLDGVLDATFVAEVLPDDFDVDGLLTIADLQKLKDVLADMAERFQITPFMGQATTDLHERIHSLLLFNDDSDDSDSTATTTEAPDDNQDEEPTSTEAPTEDPTEDPSLT